MRSKRTPDAKHTQLQQQAERAINSGLAPAWSNRLRPAAELGGNVGSVAVDTPAGPQPGMMFHHYQLIRELGRGGMGAVYLARDTRLGRRVAMKFVAHKDRAWAARFLSEARATARCEHENIVSIHHADEAHGHSYMVLEYIEGITLHQWMRQSWQQEPEQSAPRSARGALARAATEPGHHAHVSPTLAVELMVPVVRALAHAHQLGLVHRDLKPENIMLTNEGAIKVLDFGIVKLLDPQPRSLLTGENMLKTWPGHRCEDCCTTGAGALMGTMPYMSPEQWGIGELDGRSDVWAVGIMLWELCTGRHPLDPITRRGLMKVADFAVPMPLLAEERSDLSPLAEIIDHCLVKHKTERMPSAQALLAALDGFLQSRPSRGVAASSAAAAGAEPDNPYVGLAAFQERDAGRFFGREREIASVVNQLRNHRLVTVAGASGTGKSSFVRAGVIPALARSGQRWEWFVVRPGRQPLAGLAGVLDTLRAIAKPAPGGGKETSLGSGAALATEPGILGTALRAHGHRRRARILLFVDQFEELYTLGADPASREAFVQCLEGVADDESSPLRVVVSMRSDFLDRVAEDRALMSDITRGLWFLPPMRRSALRAALLQPLQIAGYELENQDQLVATMLDALNETNAPLPLLQFTAARLWDLRDPEQKRISAASYEQLGGVAGALAAHANTVFAGLSTREQGLARTVFTSLVTEERTRAIVSLDELRARVPAGAGAAVEAVVQHLAAARLLLMETDMDRGGATVEIAHESLIATWPRLGEWLSEDQEECAFRARLFAAARGWDKHARSEDLLWRGQAADDAWRWLERWRNRDQGDEGSGASIGRSPGQLDNELAAKSANTSAGRFTAGSGPAAAGRATAGQASTAGPDLGARDLAYLRAVVALAARTRKRRRRLVAGAFAMLSAVALVVSVLAVYASRQADEAAKHAALADEKAVLAAEQAALASSESIQARNASRIASAREYQSEPTDPTLVLALVRELEASDKKLPPRWRELARWAMYQGVAQVILAHPAGVVSASFSPDGRRIVTASLDNEARVWNADGSGPPMVLSGHQDGVLSASFSPDGQRIVTASYDRTARIWHTDSADAGAALVFAGHGDRVISASFSPDGQRIVTASYDRTARVWNADGSAPGAAALVVLSGHHDRLYSASFSPDGRRIVTASRDGTARVWNADGSGVPIVLSGHQDSVTSASFSPDGRRIVTSSLDNTARVWNADGSGAPVVLSGHHDRLYSASFSPDGQRVVTASRDRTARVWHTDGSGAPRVLQGHQDRVYAAWFSPDGRRIVTASVDKTARVWNADPANEPLVLLGHEDIVASASFSPDAQRIVTASFDRTARIWNADGMGTPRVLQGHQDIVTSASFSPDGRHIVTASYDQTARIWNADGSGLPMVLSGHRDIVYSASFSPDSRRVVTASFDKTARVWSVADAAVTAPDGSPADVPAPLVLQGHQDSLTSASFSPDGQRIVTTSRDRTARIWNADGSGPPIVLAGHSDVVSSAWFSPDGQHIVTASLDKTVRVWNADGSGAPVVFEGLDAPTATGARGGGGAFSPDGARMVTISDDKTIRVWNADGTGQPVIVRASDLEARSASFAPDGTRIVSASHSVRIAATGKIRHVAKVWPSIERFRDLADPRLWRATNYCPPIGRRMELLGVSMARAARDLVYCRRRVAAARVGQE